MNSDKPVLVTTDGSAHSHRVLPHAALLAKALDKRLVLVQVLQEAYEDAERSRAEARATLQRVGVEGEVAVEALEGQEKPAAAILRIAARLDAAVLAIDSRGHGALRHALHGSVALDILREASLPVLVSGPNLEPAAREASPYRIVATSDGSPASEAVLNRLGGLSGSLQVALFRVHEHEPAGQGNEEALQACQEALEAARRLLPVSMDVQTEVRDIARGGGVDTAIVEKAREFGAHAIAMSTHGHSARRHVVMGSMAMTLLGRSPLPLLLARAL